MSKHKISCAVKGHCKIVDDLGNILLDKHNAIHPRNLARVFARALSNEGNFSIYRIAFGNGGTTTDAAYTVTYNTPNDGYPPDIGTWDSRLYNETYSEIIDETSIEFGVDPGSADSSTGTRPGGGSVPGDDPSTGLGVTSSELGLESQVKITCVLNPSEPGGQLDTDQSSYQKDGSFVFDEIGLYTGGAPAIDSYGIQDVDVGNKTSEDATGLATSTTYEFEIEVDNSGFVAIEFTTPTAGSGPAGEILYGDLCQAINTGSATWNPAWGGTSPLPNGAKVTITNTSGGFSSLPINTETYGFLRFSSATSGTGSTIELQAGSPDLFAALGGTLKTSVNGKSAGVQNNPSNAALERERLLTHLIFSPVLKAANRTLTVTYTLDLAIDRTEE